MNKKSFAISILSAVLLVSLTILPTAEDQPSQQVLDAIAKGVEWLAAQQNSDGSWGTWEVCAVTVLATKKLEHHAVDPEYGLGLPSPFDENFAFREHVGKGLGHLFSNCAQIRDISVQTVGNPDTNGNGKGIAFGVGSREMYDTGVALMTICEAVELDRTIESGPLAGKTYEQVARDTMDYLVFGQGDSGDDRGGWGYMAINNNTTDGWTDNSNSGYVTLGLGYAQAPRPEGCGFELPQFVKNGLDYWIKTMQDPVNGDSDDGGSWYSLDYIFNPSWVNLLKTGNLLQQMALYGDSVVTQRVKDALGYVCRHWSDANQDPGWMGWPG